MKLCYSKVRAEGFENEARDCAVVSMALACNIEYAKAHEALKNNGRKNKRGTYIHQLHNALDTAEIKWRGIGTYDVYKINKGKQATQRTIGRILKRGHFICSVKGHFFALVNGEVKDWSEGRCHRIKDICQIFNPKGETTMYYLVDHEEMKIVAAGENEDKLFELGENKLTGDFKVVGGDVDDFMSYKVSELKQMCEHMSGEPCTMISNQEQGAYRVLSLAASADFKLPKEKTMSKKTSKKVTKKVAKKTTKKVVDHNKKLYKNKDAVLRGKGHRRVVFDNITEGMKISTFREKYDDDRSIAILRDFIKKGVVKVG